MPKAWHQAEWKKILIRISKFYTAHALAHPEFGVSEKKTEREKTIYYYYQLIQIWKPNDYIL